MKTILVPVERSELAEATLATALLLGQAFDSYIEGFPLWPLIAPITTDALGHEFNYPDIRPDRETVAGARALFESFMTRHGVPARAAAYSGPCFGWLADPQNDGFVGSYGRVFDATVLGRPCSSSADPPRLTTLEAALFESGRPILVAPPVAPKTLGRTVVIAWNRSTETARSIGFAMPILRRASRVVVVAVAGTGVPGPSADQLCRHLEMNGIPTEDLTVEGRGRSVGVAVLEAAAALGCDLLVKGAFTQSRLRQMIFGGATRHIIAETTMPVLMAH